MHHGVGLSSRNVIYHPHGPVQDTLALLGANFNLWLQLVNLVYDALYMFFTDSNDDIICVLINF